MPDPRQFDVILNRRSGTLGELWHDDFPGELEKRFREAGITARVRALSPEELDGGLDEAIAAEPDVIVVGGGDGTVASAAKRLAGQSIPLGVLPFGTFNFAARDLGIPLELEAAVPALAAAPVETIDILDVGDQTGLCCAILGFYPALCKREKEFHGRAWWKKVMRVIGQTVTAWRRSPALDLEMTTAEGKQLRARTRFMAFVPGEYDDIFSVIPQRTDLATGTMTIYLSRHRTILALLRGCLAYLFGMLEVEKDIERIKTTSARVNVRRRKQIPMMVDGEIVDMTMPIEFSIRPRTLRVLRPGRGSR